MISSQNIVQKDMNKFREKMTVDILVAMYQYLPKTKRDEPNIGLIFFSGNLLLLKEALPN